MRISIVIVCVIITLTSAQLPPRLNIPGAVLLSQPRPSPFRQQRIQGDSPPPRLRRPPIQNAAPAPVRPVVEEPEEPQATPSNGNFEDEVTKLGIAALQNAVRQTEEETTRPVHFRPERPIPVLRQDIRDGPPQRPAPVLRQEQRENIPRPLLRQDPREEAPVQLRQQQPVRQSQPRQHIPIQAPPQPARQPTRGSHPARQPSQYLDDEGHQDGRPGRTRKPPVQILKKYRTDNADGSISWGFENDDGTFKEENLGTDCIIRGKYGYVDPDGVRREYKYEAGNKCDEPEEEEDLGPERPQQVQAQPRRPPPQYRPLPGGQI